MSEKGHDPSTWSPPADVVEGSPTAVWACRSPFCLSRGPYWTRSARQAKLDADKHRARRFLGLFGHDAVAGPRHGQTLLQFLGEMKLAAAAPPKR